VDWREGFEGPDADGAVGAAGYEGGGAHLELADEGGVALKDCETAAGGNVSGGRRGLSDQLTHHTDPRCARWYLDCRSPLAYHQRRWRRSD